MIVTVSDISTGGPIEGVPVTDGINLTTTNPSGQAGLPSQTGGTYLNIDGCDYTWDETQAGDVDLWQDGSDSGVVIGSGGDGPPPPPPPPPTPVGGD